MDGREQLRRYLEQRRDAGEREFVLDTMTVDDVMRMLDRLAPTPAAPPVRPRTADREVAAPRVVSDPPPGDWREVLAATQAPSPPTVQAPPTGRYSFAPPEAVDTGGVRQGSGGARWPAGLSVGQPHTELFTGPLAGLETLDAIAREVAGCTRCPLGRSATNPVPGEGSANAGLVCVGEAPGATEDATGRPFVGQAGKLLDKILGAIQLQREQVYICNVLKHRPPGNRNPLPDEVAACSPFLVRQLEIIRPKVIVAFGTFAAQTLLATKDSIGKLRLAVHRYYGVPLIVTYHPAALLRNPGWKRPTWEDVQYARRILDGTGL